MYSNAFVTSGCQATSSAVPFVHSAAMVAGVVLAFFGIAHFSGEGSLYSAVQISQPIVSASAPVVLPARTTRVYAGASAKDEDIHGFLQRIVDAAPSQQPANVLQASVFALAGAILGAIGASFMMQKTRKSLPWVMAAVDEDDTLLPTTDEFLLARQEWLRLQGKGPGAQLAPGEVLRAVNFPGKSEPVDLVEMYKQFEEMLGDTVRNPAVGTRLIGTVFDVDDRGASVDFGGKTIGYCPSEELALCKVKNAEDVVTVGEQREFDLIAPPSGRRKDGDEFTLLSLKTIAEQVAWKRLQQYRENDVTFSVVIKGKNRGGYMVEVDDLGLPGFLPKSQATSDLATAPENADPAMYMELNVDVKVLDLDQERKRLVVSQRAANPKVVADTFKVGTVHEGIVQNVKPYGVFVDVNGMSGLLHISQISHNRIDNVESIFKVGDKIKCMVLSQDQVQGRLALSTKRLEPTHGDMLVNPQLVYEKAEEMAERFREDIAAAEKRMQEFEAKLAEQNTPAFG